MYQQEGQSYRGFRLPGLRLTEELLPQLAEHRTEKMGPTLPSVHEFDKAHLVMLTEEGLIPRSAGVAMLRALREMESEGYQKVRFEVQGGAHSGEQYLIRTLGENVGGWIHVGRSSGDLSEVGRRYTIRTYLLEFLRRLNTLRRTVVELIPRYTDVVLPGASHGQAAQPTTFSHWLAMWGWVFRRDFERALGLYGRVNLSPTGAGILSGSDFAINRVRTAELLGFSRPVPNTMDAILSHDAVLLETASMLMIHSTSSGRLAEDIELWFGSGFGFIDIPDRFCDTSSIMPQKKNPVFSEEVKAASARAIGTVMTVRVVESGPTGLTMNEHGVAQEALWKTFEECCDRLDDANALLPEIRVNPARMYQAASEDWTQATDLAGGIVRSRGIPWRTAHQIVAIAVRLAHERSIAPANAMPALLAEAAELYSGEQLEITSEELADWLSADKAVHRRTLQGGPAPERVLEEAAALERDLASDDAALTELELADQRAHTSLEAAIDDLLVAGEEGR